MDILTLFTAYIILIVLVLLFSVAGIHSLFEHNSAQPTKVLKHRYDKETQHHNIYQYRLSRMLAYLGFSTNAYITKLPEDEIRKHIVRCKTCPNISLCDRCLRDGETIQNMLFCPNYLSLLTLAGSNADRTTN